MGEKEGKVSKSQRKSAGWLGFCFFILNPHRLCKVIKCLFCWFKDSGERRRRSRQRRDLRKFARSPDTRNGGTPQRSFTVTWMMEGADFWGWECVFFSHPEGRGSAESVQGRVRRIQQLREALGELRGKMEAGAEQTDICQHVILIIIHTTGDQMKICAESTLIVFYYSVSAGI